jgi:hypothetical protein
MPTIITSHVCQANIPLAIIIGFAMCCGLCIYKKRRTLKQWRVPGIFGQNIYWRPSSLSTLLPSWNAKPLVLGYEERHWTNYDSIGESVIAAEQTLDSEARWLPPMQPTAPRHRLGRRRHSRRRRYPERANHVTAQRVVHRSPNTPSYWNDSRQEIRQAASLGTRTTGKISGHRVRTYISRPFIVPYTNGYPRWRT